MLLQCDVGYFTPQEEEQLKTCDPGIAYIPVDGGIQVIPSQRGPGTLCIDYNECQAHECAKRALECLMVNSSLYGCEVNTTLPDGINAVRLWRPPPEPVTPTLVNANSSNRTNLTTAAIITTTPPPEPEPVYFGVFVKSQPCEADSMCWNSLGSYQCICSAGYARIYDNVTLTGSCQGMYVCTYVCMYVW